MPEAASTNLESSADGWGHFNTVSPGVGSPQIMKTSAVAEHAMLVPHVPLAPRDRLPRRAN